MGVSSASSECLERIRLVVKGLEGVQQIKDDIVVLKAGKEHDSRLVALLERSTEYNINLRREKCKFEVPEVQIYSMQGITLDAEWKQVIMD